MSEGIVAFFAAAGSAIAAVLAAWALVVKARSEAARPATLVRRLWDWIESHDLDKHVPKTLARDIRKQIEDDDEE